MRRSLALHLPLGLLLLVSCVREPIASAPCACPEPTPAPAQAVECPTPSPKPAPVVETKDDSEAISRYLACHPYEVARIEFAPNDFRTIDYSAKAELDLLVARWNMPPGPEGALEKILVIGHRSADEHTTIDGLRAELVLEVLVDAGARSTKLLAAGFGVPSDDEETAGESQGQEVIVLEVCGICCLL